MSNLGRRAGIFVWQMGWAVGGWLACRDLPTFIPNAGLNRVDLLPSPASPLRFLKCRCKTKACEAPGFSGQILRTPSSQARLQFSYPPLAYGDKAASACHVGRGLRLPEKSQTSHLELFGEAPPRPWLAERGGCQDGGCHVAGVGFPSPSLGRQMTSAGLVSRVAPCLVP